MNIILFLIGLFFIIVLLFPFITFKREGLTPFDDESTIAPISLSDLEKEVEDLSGNVLDLKNTVDQLVVSQANYLNKNPLPQANVSLAAVS